MEVRCTPNHRFFTANRGFVGADELLPDDRVVTLAHPAPAVDARYDIPVSANAAFYRQKGDHTSLPVELPSRWTPEFAHYLGWLVGDGFVSEKLEVAGTVYGSLEDQEVVLPVHRGLVAEMHAGFESRLSVQANGVQQLRIGRKAFARFFEALGVSTGRAARKVVPWSIRQAPPDIAAAFLRGLFDADGCVYNGRTNRYVGLASRSVALVRDVQRLLTTFGIASRVYRQTRNGSSFTYIRKDGQSVEYGTERTAYDLRISGRYISRFAEEVGLSLRSKMEKLAAMLASEQYKTESTATLVERTPDGVELTYNLSEPNNHSYVVNGLVVANCSEFVFVDDTACNLLSLNLMKFQAEDGSFDVERFRKAVDVCFTGQEIIVSNASYPTPAIAANSERLRPLGLGYANLGALVMSMGLAYDSDEGRRYAGAITAIMTAEAYAQSARMAAAKGPFAEFGKNREPMLRVMRKHRSAAYELPSAGQDTDAVVAAARETWDEAVRLGETHGYRNAQATVLAPTGCLVGGTLVATDRGLVRLRSLGRSDGAQWQDLKVQVATDEGPRQATRFFVNGTEPVVTVATHRGYRIQGTATHRIKVVDEQGQWTWRHLADVKPGDQVPLMLGGMIGESQTVPLPDLPEAYWTSDFSTFVPREMNADLAELVGYFMGDGSLHSRGLRLCVTSGDADVVERLRALGESLFGLKAAITPKTGYTEVALHSVRLSLWWEACGFTKEPPTQDHRGKGYRPRIPDALLNSNDPEVYSAFVRGLFEADGTVTGGFVSFSTVGEQFSRDVQSLLLALGFVTTLKQDPAGGGRWGSNPLYVLRLLNVSAADGFVRRVGFISARKRERCLADHPQAAKYDQVPVDRDLVDALAPENDQLRKALLLSLSRTGMVSRRAATTLLERTGDVRLRQLLSFFYDRVGGVELGEEQFTFDLSVPDNVTYVANGFVSHNTIGLMMDCDTTGIEPDLALVKYKKLVGGGLLKIVNNTVPAALRKLGYGESQVKEIVEFIDENDTIEGAPHITDEHLKVFDCAFKPVQGTRSIAPMGHVRMMAAVQPFISGSMSKTVNLPTEATVEDIEGTYLESWRLGLKCIAIYRDGCKRSQPLSTSIEKPPPAAEAATPARAVRRRLPDERRSLTHKFDIQGHEGYITVGLYEDGTPGEIFLTMAKEGSTISGLMDAFATQTSLALQYGVPLQVMVNKFSHMRFEPSGFTKHPEIPIAKSLADYIFRWLASKFLSEEEKDAVGVVRREPSPEGESEPAAELKLVAAPPQTNGGGSPLLTFVVNADAPACADCGSITVRSGSCYKCLNCGATTGCS